MKKLQKYHMFWKSFEMGPNTLDKEYNLCLVNIFKNKTLKSTNLKFNNRLQGTVTYSESKIYQSGDSRGRVK